jgi:acyl dehydratase
MSDPEIKFPNPFRMNGRLYWRRSSLETYKRAIIRQATGATDDPEPVHNDAETFVTAEQVTKEFGFGRRT